MSATEAKLDRLIDALIAQTEMIGRLIDVIAIDEVEEEIEVESGRYYLDGTPIR